MAELKTKQNDASVLEFIASIAGDVKRQDSLILVDLFTKITGQEPKMWGTSIIGFGQYHYKSERSSQEGDWPLVAFSPRKASLTLYVMSELEDYSEQLQNLGKYKTSKACLYINKLADVDMQALEQLIRHSYDDAKKNLT